MTAYLLFGLGVVLAAAGGELFVRGVVAIARQARVPAALVAATIAAFATSSPELAVSVLAALDGTPQLGLGDALGSNVVNLALVLGLTLLVAGVQRPGIGIRREVAVVVAAPILIGLLAMDGTLSRGDAAVLLAAFAAWLTTVLRTAHAHRRTRPPAVGGGSDLGHAAAGVGGLLLLVVAGRLIVPASRALAAAWGIDDYVIGATVVALGTSTPELATALVSKLRGHEEVGLGTLLGSNLFNGLFIVAVAALVHPIPVRVAELVPTLGAGVLVALLVVPGRSGELGRGRGALLLCCYAAYVVLLLRAAV